jgi:hypothetical protein
MRGTKKENRKSVRTRRAKRKFAFLKQLRRDTALSPSAKIVVWSLADGFYNLETEQCNAGFTTLGRAIGRSQRQTQRSIKEAAAAGWITISSIGGGSRDCTNRYALVWDKIANGTGPDKSSAKPEKPIKAPEPVQTTPSFEDGQFIEIIDENEFDRCHSRHGCHEWSPGVSCMSNEPTPNLKGEEGRRKHSAALGFAAPLMKEEEEMAFQQLWELWQVKEQFAPAGDMAKSRAQFAAVWAEYGETIRAEHGVDAGYYLQERAKAWIKGSDSPRYLKKLEVWLGAPDGKGDAVAWWQKDPSPRARGRGGKPDLAAVALNGRRHA